LQNNKTPQKEPQKMHRPTRTKPQANSRTVTDCINQANSILAVSAIWYQCNEKM